MSHKFLVDLSGGESTPCPSLLSARCFCSWGHQLSPLPGTVFRSENFLAFQEGQQPQDGQRPFLLNAQPCVLHCLQKFSREWEFSEELRDQVTLLRCYGLQVTELGVRVGLARLTGEMEELPTQVSHEGQGLSPKVDF